MIEVTQNGYISGGTAGPRPSGGTVIGIINSLIWPSGCKVLGGGGSPSRSQGTLLRYTPQVHSSGTLLRYTPQVHSSGKVGALLRATVGISMMDQY